MDLRYQAAIDETRTVLTRPYRDRGKMRGEEFQHIIEPGQKEKSFLWRRIGTSRAKHRMPPVGSSHVDPLGQWLIGKWIDDHISNPN